MLCTLFDNTKLSKFFLFLFRWECKLSLKYANNFRNDGSKNMVIVCLNKVAAYSVKMWVLVDVALVIVCRTTGNQSVVLSCSVSTHCILCACMNLLLGNCFSWHPLPLLLTVCCFTGTRMLHPESSAARNNLAWRNANQLEFFFFSPKAEWWFVQPDLSSIDTEQFKQKLVLPD